VIKSRPMGRPLNVKKLISQATRRKETKRYEKSYRLHIGAKEKERPPDPPLFMTGTRGARIRRALTKKHGRPKWWLFG